MRSTTILLVTSALLLGLGCAPSNPGMVAEGIIGHDTSCLYTPTSAFLIEGSLDVATPPERVGGITYLAVFRVGNQLINNGNRVYPLMADPNRIVFDHVEVTLVDLNETVIAGPYLVPASGAVGSTASMDPTFGLASATIIPDNIGQSLAGFADGSVIVARCRVMGTTAGGAQLTSGPVSFPITLCNGCLFRCGRDEMGNAIESLTCSPGQDGVSLVTSAC
ncbi:MAG: hypothetical protein U0234_24995 [Sandaracinus sp.]